MKIAFCIIAEGDTKLESLKRLIDSADGVYSTVHITVNGGEPDGKQTGYKKVEKWCKEMGFDFTYLPWNESFSEQRNYNFSRAPEDTDYILWADADDVIINSKLLLAIADKAKRAGDDAVAFTYWYGAKFDGEPSVETFKEVEIEQKRERLLKPGVFVWKKRLHESPTPKSGIKPNYSLVTYSLERNPIAWLHLGADRKQPEEALKRRMVRNRRLLEMDIQDERKEGSADPRSLLYLMKIYAEDDDKETLKKLLDMGKEYISKSGWDEERAVCYKLMSVAYGKLGDYQMVVETLHKAISEYPTSPLLYLYLARGYKNLKNYRAMKHWLGVGLQMDAKGEGEQMSNLLEMKVLTAQLLLDFHLYGDRNTRGAYEAAVMLNKIDPRPEYEHNEQYLYNLKELDIACEHAHKLMQYYEDIGNVDTIPLIYESMPRKMKELPFANNLNNKYKKPRIWESNEICYFANFNGPHFEKWSPKSLEKGIGGSETAVIRLSEEWAKMGWRVTMYGDPGDDEGEYNGVVYLPWYKFNIRDNFNIFIQWRNNILAGRINCKKFLVDLHDLWDQTPYLDKINAIDKIMVKSEFHKNLAPDIPVKLFSVVSNGI